MHDTTTQRRSSGSIPHSGVMVMVFHLFYLLSLTEMFHGTLVSYVILIDYLELVTLPIHPSSITICQLVQTSLCPTPVQSQEGKQL